MKTKFFIMLVCLAVSSYSYGSIISTGKVEKPETSTKAAAVELKMMIVAKLSVKPDKIKDFITAAKEMIEKSNKESGCTSYQLYQDPYDNTKFVFVEEYKDQASVDAHFATEYFKAFGPKIGNMVTAPAEIKIISVAKEVKQ